MEEGKITILVPEEKTFKVNRLKFRGIKDSEFKGPLSDCSYLALWYYNNKNIHAKNLIINIHGNYHITYPNPAHLTVEFIDGQNNTGKLHMSWNDLTQSFYEQTLSFGRKKKKSKTKKIKKKLKSKSKK